MKILWPPCFVHTGHLAGGVCAFLLRALEGCQGIVLTHVIQMGGQWERIIWAVLQKL